MNEIEEWIQEAATNLGVVFLRCPLGVSAEVVQKARDAFVNDNPRVWWLNLKKRFTTHPSKTLKLADVLPDRAEKVWFIPETGETALPVYDLSPDQIELIRDNCPLFEYYVVDRLFQWLIVETDHDVFLVCS